MATCKDCGKYAGAHCTHSECTWLRCVSGHNNPKVKPDKGTSNA